MIWQKSRSWLKELKIGMATKVSLYVLTPLPGHNWGLHRSRWDGSQLRPSAFPTYLSVVIEPSWIVRITNASGLSSESQVIGIWRWSDTYPENPSTYWPQHNHNGRRGAGKWERKITFAWFPMAVFKPCVIRNLCSPLLESSSTEPARLQQKIIWSRLCSIYQFTMHWLGVEIAHCQFKKIWRRLENTSKLVSTCELNTWSVEVGTPYY